MAQQDYLKNMGIDQWVLRQTSETNTSNQINHQTEDDKNDWARLEQQVAECRLCGLEKSRTQTVFGSGSRQASLMIIGEAPGADEDRQGKPFVGRAGQLLTLMLEAIGIQREDVFITNILKCRPPNNRDPSPHEVRCCTPYLQQQINFIQPKVMVALGRIAAHFLLETNASLGSMRGKFHYYGEQKTPLFITYHPAYLLRSPGQKAKSYADLRQIKTFIAQSEM
ncbi:MAG: uracil-DNA glycosylase [Pseudomonadota bacterium]